MNIGFSGAVDLEKMLLEPILFLQFCDNLHFKNASYFFSISNPTCIRMVSINICLIWHSGSGEEVKNCEKFTQGRTYDGQQVIRRAHWNLRFGWAKIISCLGYEDKLMWKYSTSYNGTICLLSDNLRCCHNFF